MSGSIAHKNILWSLGLSQQKLNAHSLLAYASNFEMHFLNKKGKRRKGMSTCFKSHILIFFGATLVRHGDNQLLHKSESSCCTLVYLLFCSLFRKNFFSLRFTLSSDFHHVNMPYYDQCFPDKQRLSDGANIDIVI